MHEQNLLGGIFWDLSAAILGRIFGAQTVLHIQAIYFPLVYSFRHPSRHPLSKLVYPPPDSPLLVLVGARTS